LLKYIDLEEHMDQRKFLLALALGTASVALSGQSALAQADVTLSGPDTNAGTLNLSPGDTYSLWGLLGGSTTSTTTTNPDGSTTMTYGDISVTTPAGDNSKNSILHDYLLATNSSGQRSLVSLGEIDPNFVGSTASGNDLLSVSGSTASLDFMGAGAAGRDLSDVVSLQLLSAGAVTAVPDPAPVSTSLTLSGNSGHAGTYNLAGLESLPATTETVNNDTYTGVALWTFLDPTDSNILNQYVVVTGTDGYEVVYSLAELDPAYGAPTSVNNIDLLPYTDTNGQLDGLPGSDSLARTILPGDTPYAHGRWDSNLDAIEIVPEPPSLTLLLSGLAPLALLRRKRRS
jgi:hypothetical protein